MVTQSKKTRAATARPSSPSQGETAPATSAADNVSPDAPGRPVAGAQNSESDGVTSTAPAPAEDGARQPDPAGANELLAESTPAEGGTIMPSQPSSDAGSAEPVSAGDLSANGEDSQGEDFSDVDFETDGAVTVVNASLGEPVAEPEERYLVLGNVKVHGRLREAGEVVRLTPTLAASIVAADNAVAVPDDLNLHEDARLTAKEVAIMVGIIAGMAEDD